MSNIWCACTGRSQSAPIAATRPSRHAGPHGFGPLCRTSPHAPLLAATRQAAPAAPGRPSASRRRRPAASAHVGAAKASHARHLAPGTARAHPRVCPLALVAPRRPGYREAVRRRAYPRLPRNRPRRAIKRGPRTHSSTQAILECSPSSPVAANRPGEASFLISGNSCRRHCPGQFGTTRTSHSPFSPPRASSSSREPFPLLDVDQESP